MFKVGDKVRKKNGEPFSRGELPDEPKVAIVDGVSGEGDPRVFFQHSGLWTYGSQLELVVEKESNNVNTAIESLRHEIDTLQTKLNSLRKIHRELRDLNE